MIANQSEESARGARKGRQAELVQYTCRLLLLLQRYLAPCCFDRLAQDAQT